MGDIFVVLVFALWLYKTIARLWFHNSITKKWPGKLAGKFSGNRGIVYPKNTSSTCPKASAFPSPGALRTSTGAMPTSQAARVVCFPLNTTPCLCLFFQRREREREKLCSIHWFTSQMSAVRQLGLVLPRGRQGPNLLNQPCCVPRELG